MTTSLLAVDLGATRIKFGVLGDYGIYRLVHSADGQTVFPKPGAAIQEPDHVMRVCIDGLKQCAAAIRRPAGLVLTGQVSGAVIVDERLAALTVRRRPARNYSGRRKSVRCQGPAMGSGGRTPARQDDQRGSARSGALKEILATLSAGAPDVSRVERERHVKLLDGNTWPMS